MMCWWKTSLIETWVVPWKQIILNFRMQDIESSPILPTIEINQPRLLLCNVTKTLIIKTVEDGVVIDIFQVPFHHFYRKCTIPSPSMKILLNNKWIHRPSCSFFGLLTSMKYNKIQLISIIGMRQLLFYTFYLIIYVFTP